MDRVFALARSRELFRAIVGASVAGKLLAGCGGSNDGAEAAATAILHFGMNTSAVNGVRGRGDFKLCEPLEFQGSHRVR